MLTRVKDTLPIDKQSRMVYRIPGSYNKVYIRKIVRSLKTRLKEHQQVCREGTTASSDVVEQMHRHQQPIKWEETTVADQPRGH